jgi:hypothetical protein
MNIFAIIAGGVIAAVLLHEVFVYRRTHSRFEERTFTGVAPDVAQFEYGWEDEYLRDWEDYEVAELDAAYGSFVDDRTPDVIRCLANRARRTV